MSPFLRKWVASALCGAYPLSLGIPLLLALQQGALAQQMSVEPVRPSAFIVRRPYLPAEVPPISLLNSSRLRDLIRAGKLYLSAQDAISLALENNIDIQVARYNPILLAWNLERAQAGGALPGVPSGASQTASVASGQGVLGSQQAAGVSGGNNVTTRTASNTTVSQIGPVTQTLDPSIQEATSFSHRSFPLSNTRQSIINVLIQNARTYSGSYQQGFVTGGSVTVSYNNHYLNENAPTDVLNPSVAPTLGISVQHNLLQGFGARVGGRNITVAKMNLATSDLSFRSTVTGVVANVLNTYYSLASDYDDLAAKNDAFETAQRFLEDSRKRLELGALAQLDVTTAENQVAASRQNQIRSQTSLDLQELQLKNLISRTGAADPLIANVEIVPLDHIALPAGDDLPSMADLMRTALINRTDLLTEKARLDTAEVSAIGTANGVLPSLQVFATKTNAGLAGSPQSAAGGFRADPYFIGGIGKSLGEIFRNNYPTETAGTFTRISIGNNQAQADYGIEQLQLRQQQLTNAKDLKQAQVDITNAVVAIRQSRARFEAAVQSRILQQQLLDAEQKKFSFGASTSYNVIQQQRDLVAARSAELAALTTYHSARINLDQTTGAILEANHVSIAEAQKGAVSEPSVLPAALPAELPKRN